MFVKKVFSTTDLFQRHSEFTNEFEDMNIDGINKCLSKFYVSIRKSDGTYYKKAFLMAI
jgi:hypothetical protein